MALPDAVNTAESPSPVCAVISSVVFTTRASTICDAIVRFQIRS
jgi:hypothetical protein